MIPEMLDRVQVRAQRGPLHNCDAVLLQKVCGDSGSMWTSIVLLESEVGVLLEVRHNDWSQHLVNISLRSNAISTTRANVLENNRPNEVVEPYSSPDHDAGASPRVSLLDVVVGIPLVAPSPHPDSAIRMMETVSTFISEEDVSPLPPVPVAVLLGPKQSLLSVSGSTDRLPCRAAAVKAVFCQSTTHSLTRNWCSIPANGDRGRFRCRCEWLTQVAAVNCPILSCIRYTGPATSWVVMSIAISMKSGP